MRVRGFVLNGAPAEASVAERTIEAAIRIALQMRCKLRVKAANIFAPLRDI